MVNSDNAFIICRRVIIVRMKICHKGTDTNFGSQTFKGNYKCF